MIPSWADHGLALFIALFVIVFCRAQGTYWLGRLAARGALAGAGKDGVWGSIAHWFNGPTPKRGAKLLDKWGLIIIPLCFLTVGIQTAVNAGAGLVSMKWRTYTLAMIPGCIAWAILYGMGMLAIWMALLGAVAGSWWGRTGLLAVAAVAIGVIAWRKRTSSEPATVRVD